MYVDGLNVYRRNSTSAKNYHVALHSVRIKCRICTFLKGRREAVNLSVIRNAKGKRVLSLGR